MATAPTSPPDSLRATWTTAPVLILARIVAPQYQRSFSSRRAAFGSRNRKRGASANAPARTLAAEGISPAEIGDMFGPDTERLQSRLHCT